MENSQTEKTQSQERKVCNEKGQVVAIISGNPTPEEVDNSTSTHFLY